MRQRNKHRQVTKILRQNDRNIIFLILDEPRGEMGTFKKLLYLACFVSQKDLEEEERHRTGTRAQREHDIEEAKKFFRETKFWKRYLLFLIVLFKNVLKIQD